MKRGWSLRRKIAVLGLLQWLVVCTGLIGYVRLRYGLGPNALLVTPSQDRIARVMAEFQQDLDSAPDKDAVFATYRGRYGADFFVVTPRTGRALAGPQPEVPAALADQMHPPQPRRPPGARIEVGDDEEPPRPGPPPGVSRERFFFVTSENPTRYWAAGRLPFGSRPAVYLIRSESLFQNELFFDWRHWLLLGLAMLAIWSVCWLPFLRALTKSIGLLEIATQKVASGDFDARAPESRSDEIGFLGRDINVLAGRLDGFVKSQKRFLGDVAHELSAPISRVQAALGILERRVASSHRPEIEALHQEVSEMSALVSELLSFSKAGLENGGVRLEPVNIAEAVRRIATTEAVAVVCAVDPGWAVKTNEAYFRRAMGNILRNAKRYAGDTLPVTVTCTRQASNLLIMVADEGPGLPPEALEHVFEPFYRSSSSRSRDTGGVGLGLAIVKNCVEACGGTVSCRNRLPHGFEVTIILPVAE